MRTNPRTYATNPETRFWHRFRLPLLCRVQPRTSCPPLELSKAVRFGKIFSKDARQGDFGADTPEPCKAVNQFAIELES